MALNNRQIRLLKLTWDNSKTEVQAVAFLVTLFDDFAEHCESQALINTVSWLDWKATEIEYTKRLRDA
jgi:hypothetical protein